MSISSANTLHPNATPTGCAHAIERERAVVAHNYQPLPVVLQQGAGEWLTDVDGRRFLDLMSAYSAVSHGHAHPRLLQTLTAQAGRLAVASRAVHTDALAPFLEKLVALAGLGPGSKALPASGGAESVETAIKAARRWGYRVKGIAADQAQIVVARNNFHGRTTTIVGFSTEADYRADFGPFTPGFVHFDFGDLDSLAAAITDRTCAVLIEPIQGEGGIIVPPAGFLAAARRLCDERNVLLILDEIQSGLGRTGRWFAHQHERIRPDGLIVGKALGGGLLPISAFVARREVIDLFEPGSHGSTFGGNPLAAAVGLEALRVIEDEHLVARSAALGRHLLARLRRIDSPLVREVRGRGLWAGVELDADRVDAHKVVARMLARGVLVKDTHRNTIRFAPPLVIGRAALDLGIDTFVQTLADCAGAAPPAGLRSAVPAAPRPAAPARMQPAPQRERAQTSVAPVLLMSAADHFEVSYRINPWMEPEQWRVSAGRLAQEARQGWTLLRSTLERLGALIELQPAVAGLPDMVFCANAGFVLDRRAVLARFKCPERQGEQPHGRGLFEALHARGLIDHVHEPPPGQCFEGAGDALWDAARGLLWCGYGQRSSHDMQFFLAETFGVPTVGLELVDPRFYHLDTCLCVLGRGDVLYVPGAFSERSLALLHELAGDRLIEVTAADAARLAANAVGLGDDIVLAHAGADLRAALEARGYRVHVVPLDPFIRAGGAACCLTLRLDQRSGLQTRVPAQFFEEDLSERRAA